MKKLILAALVAAGLGMLAPAHAERVADPTPTGTFSDEFGNKGYVEVDPSGAVRACNENENTPGGDSTTGYVWVNANGEGTTPSYGNANIGAGDADGIDDGNATNGSEDHDCP